MIFDIKKIIFITLITNICFLNSFDGLFQNQVKINFKNDLVENVKVNKTNKSKIIAVGISALLPGIGHFYLGDRDRGALYTFIEVSGWMSRDYYKNKAEKSSIEYKNYASDHWSIAKWIRDYFNPTGNLNDDVYNLFIVDDEFARPWDHSHKLDFYYNDYNRVISTNSSEFIGIYEEICNTDESTDYICNSTIEEIQDKITNQELVVDHHFFEGVSKYNMFFAGWDDSNEGYTNEQSSGYMVAYSPNKLFYENTLRAMHKKNNDKANNILSAIFINHFASMLDILFNKKWRGISVSTESYSLSDNRYGIDKINFSLNF